jgi:hypothetical protein
MTMSRHIPRHQRWNKLGPNEYQSGGTVVRFDKGAWWAVLSYRELPVGADATDAGAWQSRTDRLGPFKRPRNAMIAAEDKAVLLKRRLGDHVAIDSPLLKS